MTCVERDLAVLRFVHVSPTLLPRSPIGKGSVLRYAFHVSSQQGNMGDSTPIHRETPSSGDTPDLAQESVSETTGDTVGRPVSHVLEEIRREWIEAKSRFDQTEDREGAELASKTQLLCDALAQLCNSVLLTTPQQTVLTDLIVCEAAESDINRLYHPGHAARAVLPIATWINSCQTTAIPSS